MERCGHLARLCCRLSRLLTGTCVAQRQIDGSRTKEPAAKVTFLNRRHYSKNLEFYQEHNEGHLIAKVPGLTVGLQRGVVRIGFHLNQMSIIHRPAQLASDWNHRPVHGSELVLVGGREHVQTGPSERKA